MTGRLHPFRIRRPVFAAVASRRAGPLLACALLLAVLPGAQAQDVADVEAGAGTGNDWIDAHMDDMAGYAARYREAFVDEIVRYHAAPRALVQEALAEGGLAAGDIYFACSLAQAIGRPCREVVEARRADPRADWATVAEGLGVESGAPVYRRIRGDISESYMRWARPLLSRAPR